MAYKHVIWDWNGTLLNDVIEGVKILNYMQKSRNLAQTDLIGYRKIFTFPILEYYKKAGFIESEHPFLELAAEYMEQYFIEAANCVLYEDAKNVLEELIDYNITNSILTAGLESMVQDQLRQHFIDNCFTAVTGKKDFHAPGKQDLIKTHIEKIKFKPDEIVFVGDTLHDVYAAQQIGCDYIIVTHGHQNIEYASDGKIIPAKNLREVFGSIIREPLINSFVHLD